MLILDSYLSLQTNVYCEYIQNLKFFNETKFMKELKERKDYGGLEDVFSNKKCILDFFQEFINTSNF